MCCFLQLVAIILHVFAFQLRTAYIEVSISMPVSARTQHVKSARMQATGNKKLAVSLIKAGGQEFSQNNKARE